MVVPRGGGGRLRVHRSHLGADLLSRSPRGPVLLGASVVWVGPVHVDSTDKGHDHQEGNDADDDRRHPARKT